MEPEVAFFISRPVLAYVESKKMRELKDASARAEKKESDAAVKKEGDAVKGES